VISIPLRYLPLVLLVLTMTALSGCSDPDKPSISLYLAVQRGDLDQLDRHIFWQSDIDSELPNGQYPLHVATEKGRIIMVKHLLDHGVGVDRETADGDTAIELAILNGRTQIAEVLLEAGAELDPSELLLKAARAGITDRDSLRFLAERDADLEQRGEDGETALLIAIRQDNHRLATHLVNLGADVNVAAADGTTALELARELNTPELISLLERFGAR
jgi:ankyrin repeat protein